MQRYLLLVCVFLLCSVAGAEPSVKVLALFPGKAMLEIDGKRKVYAAGQSAAQGVRLISADTERAVVEIAGQREELRIGSVVSATYQRSERREIRILKGRGGYYLDGLINGQSVRFLVDTGATSVAMSERHAARLGLRHRVDGVPVGVGTASGDANGHGITLDSLTVGSVKMTGVAAIVIDGDSPRHVLLGMNVLSRFDIDQRANLLILRTKY